MAIFHLQIKIIKRSKGQSSVASAAYRAGEKITDERTGIICDYSRKSEVDFSEILAPENAPNWVHDRKELWNRVEEKEIRIKSQLAREIEVSLPIELNKKEKIDLVRGFINEQFIDLGMVADLNIHGEKSNNPHAHIMLTTRHISETGFGNKNREWNDKKLFNKWREEWANHSNSALQKAGLDIRIDHRSYADQGIEKIPQIHLGKNVIEMKRRGIKTDRGDQFDQIEKINAEIVDLEKYKQELKNKEHESKSIFDMELDLDKLKEIKSEPNENINNERHTKTDRRLVESTKKIIDSCVTRFEARSNIEQILRQRQEKSTNTTEQAPSIGVHKLR